jgi:uracil-DNA glycosylase
MSLVNTNIKLPKDWENELQKVSGLWSLERPIKFIKKEIDNNKSICPNQNDIFKAFEFCPFSSTRVVIFGQDPYFQKGVANGLAFSVNEGKKIPPSLQNIYKEIKNDIGQISNMNGFLKDWSSQGVLLLNSSLTVELGYPESHSNIGWEDFVSEIVKILSCKREVVFILWGNHAKKYLKFIDSKNNLILTSSHPSPLSSYRGFFGCKHFSQCNTYLENKNIKKIDW